MKAFFIVGGILTGLAGLVLDINMVIGVGIVAFIIGLFIPSGKKQSQGKSSSGSSRSSSPSRSSSSGTVYRNRQQIIQRMNYLLSEMQITEQHAMQLKSNSSIDISLNGFDLGTTIGMLATDKAVQRDRDYYLQLKEEYDYLNSLL